MPPWWWCTRKRAEHRCLQQPEVQCTVNRLSRNKCHYMATVIYLQQRFAVPTWLALMRAVLVRETKHPPQRESTYVPHPLIAQLTQLSDCRLSFVLHNSTTDLNAHRETRRRRLESRKLIPRSSRGEDRRVNEASFPSERKSERMRPVKIERWPFLEFSSVIGSGPMSRVDIDVNEASVEINDEMPRQIPAIDVCPAIVCLYPRVHSV